MDSALACCAVGPGSNPAHSKNLPSANIVHVQGNVCESELYKLPHSRTPQSWLEFGVWDHVYPGEVTGYILVRYLHPQCQGEKNGVLGSIEPEQNISRTFLFNDS